MITIIVLVLYLFIGYKASRWAARRIIREFGISLWDGSSTLLCVVVGMFWPIGWPVLAGVTHESNSDDADRKPPTWLFREEDDNGGLPPTLR